MHDHSWPAAFSVTSRKKELVKIRGVKLLTWHQSCNNECVRFASTLQMWCNININKKKVQLHGSHILLIVRLPLKVASCGRLSTGLSLFHTHHQLGAGTGLPFLEEKWEEVRQEQTVWNWQREMRGTAVNIWIMCSCIKSKTVLLKFSPP